MIYGNTKNNEYLFIVNILSILFICIFGTISGTVFCGIITSDYFLIFKRDFAGIPVLVYAFLTTLPFLIPLSFVSCFGMYLYSTRLGAQKNFVLWLKDFVICGSVLGFLYTIPFLVFYDGSWDNICDNLIFIPVCTLTGVSMSIPLSILWYAVYNVRC